MIAAQTISTRAAYQLICAQIILMVLCLVPGDHYSVGPIFTKFNMEYVFAEFILDSAARLEMRQIDWNAHVQECLDHAADYCAQPGLLSSLDRYLRPGSSTFGVQDGVGTPFPSLNRADTYLISFCSIPFDGSIVPRLLEAWYALMTYFLLQDDLSDIRQDLKNQEENALLDAGLSDAGAARIRSMIRQSQVAMEKINPVLANRIECSDQTMDIEGLIRKIREEMSGAQSS